MSRRIVSSLCATILAGCTFQAPALANEESLAVAISREVQAIFQRARDAVVRIEGTDANGRLCGTGFFIDPTGIVLTSYSVGGESDHLVIRQGDLKIPARRLVADCRSGIAILQTEKQPRPTPFLPLAKESDLEIASPAVIVSYPLDHPLTPNFGFIGGLQLRHRDRYFATTHIRANIHVHRGDGGAPLLNMKGEVVGVVISGIENGCLALPIEAASKVYNDYIRYGNVRPGWLGVVIGSQSAPEGGSAAVITGLEDDGPARQAGLRVGDVLLKVGNHRINSPDDMVNAAFFLTSGEPVTITVKRPGEEELEIEVTPTDRPSLVGPRPTRPGIPFGSDDITGRD